MIISATEWTALGLSIRVALGAVLAVVPIGIFLGWLLARKNFRGKLIVESLVRSFA